MEELLPGGFVTTVVRIGATVRRPPSPDAAFVHDLTAGTPLAGPAEVVCHSDLSPRNTVYRDTGHGLRLLCDSHGLDDRSHLVDTILWWQDRCWRGIESGAAAGDPARARLRDRGATAGVRAAHAWVAANQAMLEAALTSDGTRRRAAV